MNKIYKYEIEIKDHQVLKIPQQYQILSFQCQNSRLVMWAEVDPSLPNTNLELYIVGTGHQAPHHTLAHGHLASVQCNSFVWHIYHGRLNQ